ncbi:hypothetical protein [Filimonas effusa]|uniref:Uncharacterized protein n=1 Tax=Filimonas effusa TaxID=2508721 RepID=A0A4Q1D316_9BACT|nr:hypothetical protein [Filimonas effusa]RXK81689.1 hypothetical protein ESB13_17995 [Filimonas effusa]
MNRKKRTGSKTDKRNKSASPNKATEIHPFSETFYTINGVPGAARDEVTRICGWSIPTFYRRLRAVTFPPRSHKEHSRDGLSYLETIGILDVYIKITQETLSKLTSIKTKFIEDKTN